VEESMILYENAVVNTPQIQMKRLGNCDHLFLGTSLPNPEQICAEFWNILIDWVIKPEFHLNPADISNL
jgi:hypothetical protein